MITRRQTVTNRETAPPTMHQRQKWLPTETIKPEHQLVLVVFNAHSADIQMAQAHWAQAISLGGGVMVLTLLKKIYFKKLITWQPLDGRKHWGTDRNVVGGGGDWVAAGQPSRNRGVNPTGRRNNALRYCVFIILCPIFYRFQHENLTQYNETNRRRKILKRSQEQSVHRTRYELRILSFIFLSL